MSFKRWIAVLVVSFFCTSAFPGELNCRVVGFSDGDTFTCLKADHAQIRGGLAISTPPEKSQPYGQVPKFFYHLHAKI